MIDKSQLEQKLRELYRPYMFEQFSVQTSKWIKQDIESYLLNRKDVKKSFLK